MIPSNNFVLCCPLLFLPSIFSNELALHIRWLKTWSFSFNINPSNEYSGLTSFRIDWFDLLAVEGTLKSLLQEQTYGCRERGGEGEMYVENNMETYNNICKIDSQWEFAV